jgi:hypothetical protein
MTGRAGLATCFNRSHNRPEDSPVIRRDHLVRKPQNPQTLASQPIIPTRVFFVGMKRAVRLDDQSMLHTEKVHRFAATFSRQERRLLEAAR